MYDLIDIQQKLEAIKQLGNNPQLLQQIIAGQVPTQAPALSQQQETLLAFYDEFAKTDEGKALAIGLGKFAKFVQAKVAK